MTVAMFCFAMTDTLIKFNAGSMSPSLVMFFLMCGGGIVFTAIALYERKLTLTKDAVSPVLIIRYLAEIAGVFGMVLALAKAPLSTVGAIVQSVPLIVTLGAVLTLGERVSWRRWLAILVGFLGVLLIIQPGAQGFSTSVLWAILAAFGLAVRDLTTRRTPENMSSACLAAYTMYAAIPFAFIWIIFAGENFFVSDSKNWLLILGMVAFGAIGYLVLIASVRMAEISVVSPYRYTRLLFMLIFGIFIFNERPDMMVLIGAALIVASGIYIMWRERIIGRT